MAETSMGPYFLHMTLHQIPCINIIFRTVSHTKYQLISRLLRHNGQVRVPPYDNVVRLDDRSIYRPLGKLFASSDILSGEEAKTLREYCATAYMESEKDLKDPYGISIETGNFAGFRERFRSRIQHFEGRQYEAAQELFRLRWGPTRSPVYVVLLAFSIDRPRLRYEYITLALWLIQTAKVPVDRMLYFVL